MTSNVYGGFAFVYDRLMADMPYEDWLAFARRLWIEHGIQPQRVVDLGCGTGTLSLALAKAGFEVYGIDLSDDMLTAAADKASRAAAAGELPPSALPQWLEQDMREWELHEPADAVLSFCDCLNYVQEEDGIIRTFNRTFEGLAEGGVFLFDMLSEHQFRTYAKTQPFVWNEEEIAYIWTCEYEEDARCIEHDLSIFVKEEAIISPEMIEAGRTLAPSDQHRSTGTASASPRYLRIDESHTQRAYPQEWIVEQLWSTGFIRVEAYADFRMRPPGPNSKRLFYAAWK